MRRHYIGNGYAGLGLVLCLSLPVFASAVELGRGSWPEMTVADLAQIESNEFGGGVWPATWIVDVREYEPVIQPTSFMLNQPPIEPVVPPTAPPTVPAPPATAQFVQSLFATPDVRRSLVSDYRRPLAARLGSELVFGSEGRFRVTTDGGNLLGKSLFAPGVQAQQRTPVVTDTRVRASRTGRLLASGSYWAPARDDLDTMLSKIDSRIIHDVIVIKGPYSVQYGPGFNFIDFALLGTPRYEGGFQYNGSTSIESKSNGQQWYGRQSAWGGNSNWGYRVGYGHRTGNDYRTGGSFDLPTSYNSRDVDVALGFNPSSDSNFEFHYLRLDQTNVEFPGLVYDINFLLTDAYELTYTLADQPYYDRLTIAAWYNRTNFEGDTSRTGKNEQIPTLRSDLGLGPDQFAVTDVDGASGGYRIATTWGDVENRDWTTLGADLIYVTQQLNDIVPAHDTLFPVFPPVLLTIPERNYPIPRSSSTDVGLFVDHVRPVSGDVTLNLGARVDLVKTDARERVPGMGTLVYDPVGPSVDLIETDLSDLKDAPIPQSFTPWSLFATLERRINEYWTVTSGVGHGVRPPTLTELYAERSFIGTLQPGLTFVEGDPELDPERLTQMDLGLHADYGCFRMDLTGFHAWIQDYITYDYVAIFKDSFVPTEDLQPVTYGNTDLATLSGFEFLASLDLTRRLTGFAMMRYVEGRDHTRSEPFRLAAIRRTDVGLPAGPRSLADDVDVEALPGIPPFEARVGVRLHETSELPSWAIESEVRLVADQNRVAETLFEQTTPGFVVVNVRGYWQASDNLLFIAGVENFTDRFYREHLDFRPGRGVFAPGVNFYFSSELAY